MHRRFMLARQARLAVALLGSALATACEDAAAPTPVRPSAEVVDATAAGGSGGRTAGKLVFASWDGQDWEIEVRQDGGMGGATFATWNTYTDVEPSLSPDGQKVAFVSDRDGNLEIYVSDLAGGNVVRLTNDPASESSPVWSPDGSKIAFVSQRDGDHEIFVMNAADGTGLTQLTNNLAYDTAPSWSPNGQQIAFASQRDLGNSEIYVMNADGTSPTRLTFDPGYDTDPDWDARGRKIAFASDRDGDFDIYVMGPDGSRPTNLTSKASASDMSPSWSPDGRKLAFLRAGAIHVMNASGSGAILVAGGSGPDWGL